jgi:Tfp pilus assembly protein PilF
MTLLAQAHERAGARELAGERYAVAVEVSESAPAESLRYANFLTEDERFEAATAVLQEAVARNPQNIDLQSNLALLYIREQDWNRATRIVWSLRAMGTEAANNVANRIETEVLSRQERTEDTIEFLEGLVEGGDTNTATLSALLQNQVRDGRLDAATELLDKRLAEDPENPDLRFLRAGLYTLSDESDKAEAEYRKLLDEFPGNERVLNTLYGRLTATGRDDEAGALIDQTLAKNPDAGAALYIKASRLERVKDFEGAIEIFFHIPKGHRRTVGEAMSEGHRLLLQGLRWNDSVDQAQPLSFERVDFVGEHIELSRLRRTDQLGHEIAAAIVAAEPDFGEGGRHDRVVSGNTKIACESER